MALGIKGICFHLAGEKFSMNLRTKLVSNIIEQVGASILSLLPVPKAFLGSIVLRSNRDRRNAQYDKQ